MGIPGKHYKSIVVFTIAIYVGILALCGGMVLLFIWIAANIIKKVFNLG